jgi:hypothetical protein
MKWLVLAIALIATSAWAEDCPQIRAVSVEPVCTTSIKIKLEDGSTYEIILPFQICKRLSI